MGCIPLLVSGRSKPCRCVGITAVVPHTYPPHAHLQGMLCAMSTAHTEKTQVPSCKTFGEQLDALSMLTGWPRSKADKDNTLKYDAMDPFLKAMSQMLQMEYHGVHAAEVRRYEGRSATLMHESLT
jgi:hypothetical protein